MHLLYNVLLELEQHGIKIKDKTFSLNWERKNKKHKRGAESGRFKEITWKDKEIKPTTLKLKTGKIKPSKEKKTKKSKGGKSSILSAFFGLF